MGLHQDWKAILKEHYGDCFLKDAADINVQLDVLIIDFLPFIFAKSKNIKTGEHFLNYVFKTVRDFFDRGGHTCVIAIDTLKYVPLAKAPTQMNRDKYSKPLSKQDLGVDEGKEVMGRGLLIHEEWHRVMANRDLREEIFRYFEHEFLTNFFRRVKKETWDRWIKADLEQQKSNAKMKRDWHKSLVIDGGTRYGPIPYVIYSSNKVVEKPEWRTYIGESDLKIPYYINYIFPGENILVNSIDSDLIRILLGSASLRIDRETGTFTSHVYLRLNDAKKIVPKEEAQLEVALTEKDPEGKVAGKKPRGRPKGRTSVTKATKKDKGKIDVAENETSIVTEEKKPEGEADCVLKSDGKGKNREKEGDTTGKEEEYYYEPDYVAINGLWFAIQEHWKRECPSVSDPIANELVLMTLGGDDFVKNLPNCGAKVLHHVYIENAEQIGDLVVMKEDPMRSMVQVDLRWDALRLLVRHVYKHKLKSHLVSSDLPSYEELRQLSCECLKRTALHCLSAEELEVKFRQMRWALLYLLNGYRKQDKTPTQICSAAGLLVPDCMERDAEGRSLHGWELKNVSDGTNRRNVVRSSSVSGQTSYRLMVDTEDIVVALRCEEEERRRALEVARASQGTRTTKLTELALFSLPLLLFASVSVYRLWRRS